MPSAPTVGTSLSTGMRFELVTANARSLPDWMKGSTTGMSITAMSTCPPIRSVRAGAAPRYGMWLIWIPASRRSSSACRCGVVPLPAEA